MKSSKQQADSGRLATSKGELRVTMNPASTDPLLSPALRGFLDSLASAYKPGDEVTMSEAASVSGLAATSAGEYIRRLRASDRWPYAVKRERPLASVLTPRQASILRFIRRFRAEHGISPSMREIGLAFGIKSPNGVRSNLNALVCKGALKLVGHYVSRGYVPTDNDLSTCSCCGRPMPETSAR